MRSSLENENGTIVEEEVSMEQNLVVRGIAFEDNISRVTIEGLNNELQTLSTIFTALAKEQLNVDIIIQNVTANNRLSISFSIKTVDVDAALVVLKEYKSTLGYTRIEHESGLAKVSIVGSGMISNPGVAAEMFEVLAGEKIEVKMVSTSEIKVSTVVPHADMVKAVETLHVAFELEEQQAVQV